MPASADDIETRLAIVERDVARLREQIALASSDAAAARVLAAGAAARRHGKDHRTAHEPQRLGEIK
ncbi:MAG: hypothetical protein ACRDQX_03215 [Pseudonocardiaceae bacterium]